MPGAHPHELLDDHFPVGFGIRHLEHILDESAHRAGLYQFLHQWHLQHSKGQELSFEREVGQANLLAFKNRALAGDWVERSVNAFKSAVIFFDDMVYYIIHYCFFFKIKLCEGEEADEEGSEIAVPVQNAIHIRE